MADAVDQVYELQSSDVTRRNRSLVMEMRQNDIPEPVALPVLKAQYKEQKVIVNMAEGEAERERKKAASNEDDEGWSF